VVPLSQAGKPEARGIGTIISAIPGEIKVGGGARAQRLQLAASVQASGTLHGAPPVGDWHTHIAQRRYVGGRFWVEFGGFWPVLEAESGLALAPKGIEGRNVKMGKAEAGGFFDFFSIFGRNWMQIGAF